MTIQSATNWSLAAMGRNQRGADRCGPERGPLVRLELSTGPRASDTNTLERAAFLSYLSALAARGREREREWRAWRGISDLPTTLWCFLSHQFTAFDSHIKVRSPGGGWPEVMRRVRIARIAPPRGLQFLWHADVAQACNLCGRRVEWEKLSCPLALQLVHWGKLCSWRPVE